MIPFDQSFNPAWWAPGPHAQTILGRFLRITGPLSCERVRLDTDDADFIDLDFLQNPNASREAPLVVLLHGLEGGSHAPYMQTMLAAILEKGWRAVAVNFRGCSATASAKKFLKRRKQIANLLAASYHSGKTEDLSFVIKHLYERNQGRPMYAVGYSIGGNILLKWLGENETFAATRIQKAAAVSVPYDLVKAVEVLDIGFNKEVYTRSLLSTLKAKALEKAVRFPGSLDAEKISSAQTFLEFDREVTARLNGFRDEMDYWTRSSSSYRLKDIRVPSLLIHAQDDPFFPGEFLPLKAIQESPHLHLVLTPEGGHLGFLSGPFPWKLEPWLERKIISFFEKKFE